MRPDLEFHEDLLTAESEMEAANRWLRLANAELIRAGKDYGECSRRYEALKKEYGFVPDGEVK